MSDQGYISEGHATPHADGTAPRIPIAAPIDPHTGQRSAPLPGVAPSGVPTSIPAQPVTLPGELAPLHDRINGWPGSDEVGR